jgi:flavodoxin
MESAIIYYSYSGNTKKVAGFLHEYLGLKRETALIEIQAKDESDKFFTRAVRAFKRKRAQIQPVNFDLSDYDTVCFGTPVWAFSPAPAMNTYLDQCLGIEGKKVILFTTYGSGTGNQRCLNYMQEILSQKGAREFKRFSIQQYKVDNREFVLSQIEEI